MIIRFAGRVDEICSPREPLGGQSCGDLGGVEGNSVRVVALHCGHTSAEFMISVLPGLSIALQRRHHISCSHPAATSIYYGQIS
jgi:hypothetical protein